MSSPRFARALKPFLIGLAILDLATTAPLAAGDGLTLSETSMTQAIRYLGLLRGEEILPEDGAWLKQQWNDEAVLSPKTVAAQLDDLAVSFERHQRAPDPLALANARTNFLKNVYCTAEQTSAPTMHRLRNILASDDIVLAADCVLGLVVTRFDVDGAVASHALTAAATGQGHDAGSDRAEIIEIIKDGFADATPAEKELVARAELRHAILERFWSRIEGKPEQRAVIDEIRGAAAADLRNPARQLENLAASKLGDVDYLAKVGDARLTAGAITEYDQWLERIAGYRFSARDRAWMQQTIIEEFRNDPRKTLGEVAGIDKMNRDYVLADSAREKFDLVAGWSADLHCYLSASSDADERRLAEVLFRHDPVTSADCNARRISRKSDTVLVEAAGQKLTEGDLKASMRFASVMLDRPLLPEEETVIRDDNIQSFNKDLNVWNENYAFYQAFLEKVDKRQSSVFLAMDERKKLFDPIYCALKTSDEPYAADYLKMFQRGGRILFEDCEQQRVTTEDELEALTRILNFLALVNGKPPFSDADVESLRQSAASLDLNKAEVTMLALNEWWSLLTLEEKTAEIARMREKGISPEADSQTMASFVNLVKLQVVAKNAMLQNCKMMAIVIQGETAIYAASLGPGGVTPNNPSGIPGEQLAGLVSSAGLAAELCKGVSGG